MALVNHLDDLQPLLAEDNLEKSDSYDKSKFLLWLKLYGASINTKSDQSQEHASCGEKEKSNA